MKIQVKEFVKKKIEVLVKKGYTRVATSLYRMVVPTATSPCI